MDYTILIEIDKRLQCLQNMALNKTKHELLELMVKRAIRLGIKAKYLLADC